MRPTDGPSTPQRKAALHRLEADSRAKKELTQKAISPQKPVIYSWIRLCHLISQLEKPCCMDPNFQAFPH
ncbi:hypothetical protein B4113_3918 [Geobacillus sp. B4113_201601]|nr:hypothetical protein B4113_3918 [Geobacillus sp. B4113_201601]